ncbi:hypothetical protein ABWH96_08665 [Marivirga tractuosa]|uniref:hypothetical protein n=1 Tax=Marivirga tractuosa TaxID=1006 RepID=UPI0035CF4D9C
MKHYISLLSLGVILFMASCGGSESNKDSIDEEVKQEEKIADEVKKSSDQAKEDAEEVEKEVDELLEGI